MDTGSLVHNASCGALDAHFLLQLAHQVFSAAHGALVAVVLCEVTWSAESPLLTTFIASHPTEVSPQFKKHN